MLREPIGDHPYSHYKGHLYTKSYETLPSVESSTSSESSPNKRYFRYKDQLSSKIVYSENKLQNIATEFPYDTRDG